MRNIIEDNDKEDVQEPAKGVLFGNSSRLKPVIQREDFFTDKVINTAKSSKVALVRCKSQALPGQYVLSGPPC
jgi:hypothetical protein